MTRSATHWTQQISIHALRVEGDLGDIINAFMKNVISIHALRVEGDRTRMIPRWILWRISIHALRVEGDESRKGGVQLAGYFYPRPPGGGRPAEQAASSASAAISIHALRVEGDKQSSTPNRMQACISIHALRVEGDSKNGQSFRLFLRKREKNLPL